MNAVWPHVAATGHRPQHLPDGSEAWVREKLGAAACWLRETKGTTVGISGMALGTDMWWAQAVLDAGLDLWAYVPYPQQRHERWPSHAKARWEALLERAAHVHVVGDLEGAADPKREAVRLLHARNDAMLRDAQAVLAVLDMTKAGGGTRSAVEKAERMRRPMVWLDPAMRRVVGPMASILMLGAAQWEQARAGADLVWLPDGSDQPR